MGFGCSKVVIVIADSLGFRECSAYAHLLPYLSVAAELLLRCRCYSRYTSPSTASLLRGLRPEDHGIADTRGAYVRDFECLPERVSAAG